MSRCSGCKEASRAARGSPVPHYCDACGYPLSASGAPIRQAMTQVIVGHARIVEEHNAFRDPFEWLTTKGGNS